MENMIKLNLRSDSEKAAADDLPNTPYKEPEFPATTARGSTDYSRRSGTRLRRGAEQIRHLHQVVG